MSDETTRIIAHFWLRSGAVIDVECTDIDYTLTNGELTRYHIKGMTFGEAPEQCRLDFVTPTEVVAITSSPVKKDAS